MSTSVTPVPKKSACLRFLRLFLCCKSTQKRNDAQVDTSAMHNIVLPTQARPSTAPEDPLHTRSPIQWKSQEEADRLRETLRLTIRTDERAVTSHDGSLEALLRGLSELDSRDSLRRPMSSISSERMSTEVLGSSASQAVERTKVELSRLKYKELPDAAKVFARPSTRALPPGLPMKPVTPSALTGKTRIPTARAKMSQILENLQKEDSSDASL